MNSGSQLSELFSVKLGFDVQTGCVSVGKFDGTHPCLACAAPGGKVIIHRPHHARSDGGSSGNRSDIEVLRFNTEVTQLCCGTLSDESENDILLIGSSDQLIGYDVENNSNVLSLNIPDGCLSIATGMIENGPNLVFVGGTCSIYGYDVKGNDQFWTVTGDDVSALALGPFLTDSPELIVGSRDANLRILNSQAEVLMEITEHDAIILLTKLSGRRFAFALANGTFGVYEGSTLLWSTKEKHHCSSLVGYDVNLDGTPELAVGWTDGKVSILSSTSGSVMFSYTLKSPTAGLVVSDYRLENRELLVAVSTDGRVTGLAIDSSHRHLTPTAPIIREDLSSKLRALQQRKKDLQAQVNAQSKQKTYLQQSSEIERLMQTTTVKTSIQPHHGSIALEVQTTTGIPIRAVVLFAEGMFEGESFVKHCNDPAQSKVTIDLVIPRLETFTIQVKTLAGSHSGHKFVVLEEAITFPKFGIFTRAEVSEPNGAVKFPVDKADISAVIDWINRNFLLHEPVHALIPAIGFTSSFGNIFIVLHGQDLVIGANNAELAATLLQSITSEVSLNKASQASSIFPSQVDQLEVTLRAITDLHSVRQRLSVEIADQSNLAKSLLLRAEDYRLMESFALMRETYAQLADVNRDLTKTYNIRNTNYEELVHQLKALNQFINRAADLYVGSARAEFISQCRVAIKANDMNKLLQLLKSGQPKRQHTIANV